MKKRGILIVGGGVLQIAALKKARELNLVTFLTDSSPTCPSKRYADYFFKIDTKDYFKTSELAMKLKGKKEINAVYTQGTDVEYTVAYAAKKAGLPGINPQAALNCNNKIKMRKLLEAANIKDVIFSSANNISEFNSALKKVGFPCFVKPADNCASRGVTRLENDTNSNEAFLKAIDACYLSKEVIIETELNGTEHSVDTVIYKHELIPAGISDRVFLNKQKYSVQSASRTPSLLPEKTQNEMYKLMSRVAKILGVNNGAFKGDLVVNKNGNVKIIEVTARTSGGFDSQIRKPLSFGIDILKATIDIALGEKLNYLDLIPRWIKWSSTISTFPKPGKIVKISGIDKLRRIKEVKDIVLLAGVGDIVNEYTDSAKRTNFITSSADTLEELTKVENKILDEFAIKTMKL